LAIVVVVCWAERWAAQKAGWKEQQWAALRAEKMDVWWVE
jgi:hypothetical protein